MGEVFAHRKYPGKTYRLRHDFELTIQHLLDQIPKDKLEQDESRIGRLLDLISEMTTPQIDNGEDNSSEDQKYLRTVRTQPKVFRKRVLENFNCQCCLSGITEPALLEASHIVPYAARKDTQLDRRNGLCLVATYHQLFDEGYITFDDDLTVRITRRYLEFSKPLQEILLRLDGWKASKPVTPISSEYLDYHRRNVFKG